MLAALPLLVADYQFLLVGLHFRRLHYAKCAPYLPRVAVIIPAWNEAAVIGTSVNRLMHLDYPLSALRIFVVDDASTDATPEVMEAKAALYRVTSCTCGGTGAARERRRPSTTGLT